MTEIDDKELKRLQKRLKRRDFHASDGILDGHNIYDDCAQSRAFITALHRKVRKLEKEREKLCEALTEQSRIGLRWAREARQVTREHMWKIFEMYQVMRGDDQVKTIAQEDVPHFLKELGLKIVEEAPTLCLSDMGCVMSGDQCKRGCVLREEAPKAARRECDCPRRSIGNFDGFDCKRMGGMGVRAGRCTITEGERDETR